jgi:5'-nucleotidase
MIVPVTATGVPNNVEYDRKITIVHTNDQHGVVDGEQYVKGLADKIKAAGEYVLTVNAGDVIKGEPINVLTGGESVVKIMNAACYDVFVPGNAEFVFDLDQLLKVTELMEFPVIVANYFDSDGNRIWDPYIIKEIGGIKVGIFGLTTSTESPYDIAKDCVAELKKEKCNVLIAIVHLGIGAAYDFSSTALAENVAGIDLVVDGHSHTALEKGVLVGDTLVVQAGAKLDYIGITEIYLKDDKIVDKKASLIDRATYTSTIKPDAAVAAIVNKELAAIDEITSTVIGETSHYLDGERKSIRTSETNLGDMVADSMRWKTKSDLAIIQGSAIRASIPAGEITIGSVLSVLPMGIIVNVVEAPGQYIRDILEEAVKVYPDLHAGFLQISGLRYSFNPDEKSGGRVMEVIIGDNKPLNLEARYIIAMPDVLFSDMQKLDYDETLIVEHGDYSNIFIEYIKSNFPIPESAAGRISFIKQGNFQ